MRGARGTRWTGRVQTPGPVPPGFVRRHTRPQRPGLVPEVQLLVAADVVALWEAMEDERGAPAEDHRKSHVVA